MSGRRTTLGPKVRGARRRAQQKELEDDVARRFPVRLYDHEREALGEAAERAGVSLSRYIVLAALHALDKGFEP